MNAAEMRRIFQLHNDEGYVEKWNENIRELKSQAEKVVSLANGCGQKSLASKASEIISDADIYARNFRKVVRVSKKWGFDKVSGLQGKFAAASEELLNHAKGYDADALYRIFLIMHRNEKDFMKSHSDEAKSKFMSSAEKYKKFLLASSCVQASKDV